jgi:hypothetical protein
MTSSRRLDIIPRCGIINVLIYIESGQNLDIGDTNATNIDGRQRSKLIIGMFWKIDFGLDRLVTLPKLGDRSCQTRTVNFYDFRVWKASKFLNNLLT